MRFIDAKGIEPSSIATIIVVSRPTVTMMSPLLLGGGYEKGVEDNMCVLQCLVVVCLDDPVLEDVDLLELNVAVELGGFLVEEGDGCLGAILVDDVDREEVALALRRLELLHVVLLRHSRFECGF